MTRLLTAAACMTLLAGVAACSDDTLFNPHPPAPQSSGSSGYSQTPPSGTGTGNPAPTPIQQPAPQKTY